MASSDNLMTLIEQPWSFRTTSFSDTFSWGNNMSDDMFFAKETESYGAITRALQETISASSPSQSDSVLPPSSENFSESGGALLTKPTGSDSDGHFSMQQTPRKRAAAAAAGPGGRVAKRNPRASKRRQTTTFITTDPANFRQMVQEITGVRFGVGGVGLGAAGAPRVVVKPEPQRLITSGLLSPPSAFEGSGFLLGGAVPGSPGQGGSGAVDFDSLCSFPTLESWSV